MFHQVVAILQDEAPLESHVKNEVDSEIKTEDETEVKTEVKPEPDKGQKFMEVESELEKMFAGIVEPVEDTKPPVTNSTTNAQQSGSKVTFSSFQTSWSLYIRRRYKRILPLFPGNSRVDAQIGTTEKTKTSDPKAEEIHRL